MRSKLMKLIDKKEFSTDLSTMAKMWRTAAYGLFERLDSADRYATTIT
jgi:hypothetical protein